MRTERYFGKYVTIYQSTRRSVLENLNLQ